jgi:N-acetyl sugar amidotransferase
VLDDYFTGLPPLTAAQWDFLAAEHLDKFLGARPEKVAYCSRCVQSNQRPRIEFDSEGVCSACRYWDRKASIDWEARADHLSDILAQHRSSRGKYDVVVPGSGGKDSAYVSHQLKTRWGMHPLNVTWAPFAYTSIGTRNLQAFVHSGFDNIVTTPNGLLHRKLTLLSTALVGDPFLPFIWGQYSYAFHMARDLDIPLVFFGENGEAEYGGSVETENMPGMPFDAWSDKYWKGVTPGSMLEVGQSIGLISQEEADSISPFYFPPDSNWTGRTLENYWYGYFTEWRPQDNYFYCAENTGFKANPEGRSEATYSKYASLDDRTDGFHYYFGLLKFGVGRATSDAAHEVREGLIERDEAIALVERYELEFPERNFDFFLDYTGLDRERFEVLANKFRADHLWEQRNGEWALKYPIWETQGT